jgi:hypothetical protein
VSSKHVTLQVECIDRTYLNLYLPPLERGAVDHERARWPMAAPDEATVS